MTLRGLCHVRAWRDLDWLPDSNDASDARYVRVSAWLKGRPICLVVFWHDGGHARAKQRPAYRPLLEIVQAAVRERHPQLTDLPDHEHDDLLCFEWEDCFCFVPDSCRRD